MLGPFATASRRMPPVLILHCHSPGVATVARRLRIDVHNNNNDDNNDNARQRGPLWPHRMGRIKSGKFSAMSIALRSNSDKTYFLLMTSSATIMSAPVTAPSAMPIDAANAKSENDTSIICVKSQCGGV